jgi:hypothetical protein
MDLSDVTSLKEGPDKPNKLAARRHSATTVHLPDCCQMSKFQPRRAGVGYSQWLLEPHKSQDSHCEPSRLKV